MSRIGPDWANNYSPLQGRVGTGGGIQMPRHPNPGPSLDPGPGLDCVPAELALLPGAEGAGKGKTIKPLPHIAAGFLPRTNCRGTIFCLSGLLVLLLQLLLPQHLLAAPAGEVITVAAVGDVMMGSDFPYPRLPAHGGRDLLSRAAPIFKAADIAMANLEGPLLQGGEPAKEPVEGRSYLFRTPPAFARNLKEAGISMVSLANNHALDFGRPGLLSTKRALCEAGVAFSSKGGEIAEFLVRGVRVGIISLSFGAPPRSIVYPEQALREIEQAAAAYDILILSVHAGAEGRGALHVAPGMELFLNEPRGDLVRFARDAIDRGADLVVAHGPHVPRALQLYRGRLIAYSLGNFATFSGVSVVGESGYAPILTARLGADGSFLGGDIHSFWQKPSRPPSPDPKGRALRLMRRLSAQDFPASPLSFGNSGEITVTP
jgi:poly-gamma-glutamate capsule biosynthesis protein CapA/YwtB (metallophosphatase superfamily)